MRPSLFEQESRREDRAKGLRGMVGVMGLILLFLVMLIVSMMLLPPYFELRRLRQEHKQVEQEHATARANEREAYFQLLWMQDPEYFEQIARDRANQAKPEEYVIRPPQEEEPRDSEQLAPPR